MKLAVYALVAALLLSGPALAQQCAPHENVEEALSRLGEHMLATGNHPVGGIEFWANPETGSFTIVGRPSSAPEMACLIMDGTDLRGVKGASLGRGRDS